MVPDTVDHKMGRVIVVDLRNVGWPLPLQHVAVLRLRPRVEPQDVVLHHARVRRHARLAILYRRAEGGSLGDELAGAVAVEAPAMVGALEAALAVDASLRQRREAMRARVVHHAPLAAAVEPRHDAEAHHHLPVRPARVEVAHRSHGYHWSSHSNRSSAPTTGGAATVSVSADGAGIDDSHPVLVHLGCRSRRRGARLAARGLGTPWRRGSEVRARKSRWREKGAMA
ncbi:Os03g0806100, partial [Oryza sativa Japonica Group]